MLSSDAERTKERARVSRQGRVVLGVLLTMGSGVALLAAPDLTGAFVRDLPFLAVGLVALFSGGILLGSGLGRRGPRGPG